MTTKEPEPRAAKREYQPTSQEQTAIRKCLARKAESAAPRLKLVNNNKIARISLDHPNEEVGVALLMEAFGTADADFLDGLLNQLGHVTTEGRETDERGLNFIVSLVKGIKPRDQIEAMLAAQMAAVHMATMRFARQLVHIENIAQQDSAERALNKFARTYTTQMEALKRYRTGGEQKLTVQHVSVSEGRPGDRGQRDAGPRRDRGRQNWDGTARTRRCTEARNDDCG
jgi:hypothetical protein